MSPLSDNREATHDADAVSRSLDSLFTEPFSRNHPLLYKPVTTLDELTTRVKQLHLPIDSFQKAYDCIHIRCVSFESRVVTIGFDYRGIHSESYAYFKGQDRSHKSKSGFAIIPGSGRNQSSEIFYELPENYQSNIMDICSPFGDVFVFVKPNEDFLAIHNGEKKIGEKAFINYLINQGASYSATYLIQSMALSKYIKEEYERFYIAGLSQGGLAALINSLQSEPDDSIIASGYSVLMDSPHLSGIDQIFLPGCHEFLASQTIRSRIQGMKTRFLFTWGSQEKYLYGRDSKEELTLKFFSGMDNVESAIHSGGHCYDEEIIRSHLHQGLGLD